MIKIREDKQNKKEYPHIVKFINKVLQDTKEEWPGYFKVNIYDYLGSIKNSTGLSHYKHPETGRLFNWNLDINLYQLLDLYTGRREIHSKERIYPGKVNGFRNYLRFVIYHELGHYRLGHCEKHYINRDNDKILLELEADNWAYNKFIAGCKIVGVAGKQLVFNVILKGAING